jgi:hypothetical protein
MSENPDISGLFIFKDALEIFRIITVIYLEGVFLGDKKLNENIESRIIYRVKKTQRMVNDESIMILTS